MAHFRKYALKHHQIFRGKTFTVYPLNFLYNYMIYDVPRKSCKQGSHLRAHAHITTISAQSFIKK